MKKNLASDQHDKLLQEIGIKLDATPDGRFKASKEVWEKSKKLMDDALAINNKKTQPNIPTKERARLPVTPSSRDSPPATPAVTTQKYEGSVPP